MITLFVLFLVFFLLIASIFKIATWTLKGGVIVATICFGVAWFIFKALFFLAKWVIIAVVVLYAISKVKKMITN